MRKINAIMILVCTVGCLNLYLGCSDEFDSVTEVNKLRLLGVSVVPPEIRPQHTGQTEIQVLWHDPEGEGRSVQFAWLFCKGKVPTATGFQQCELVDPVLLPPTVLKASEGGDTFTIPRIPPELIEGVPQGEREFATVIVLLCAGGDLPPANELLTHNDTADINALCQGGEGLSAYKAMVFANGNPYDDAPNERPVVTDLYLDGVALIPVDGESGAEPEVRELQCAGADDCDLKVELEAHFSSESYQSYTVVEFGDPEVRTETPFISWFASGGELSNARSVSSVPGEPAKTEWKFKAKGDYLLWIVANDNRGGVSWQEHRIRLE
jgi:hypothetical protein